MRCVHTAEIVSMVWGTPRRLSLWCDAHRGDCLYSVMHSVEIDLAVCSTPCTEFLTNSRLSLRNIKEFEKILVWLSGAQMGLNHEKYRYQKSRDTLPLRNLLTLRNLLFTFEISWIILEYSAASCWIFRRNFVQYTFLGFFDSFLFKMIKKYPGQKWDPPPLSSISEAEERRINMSRLSTPPLPLLSPSPSWPQEKSCFFQQSLIQYPLGASGWKLWFKNWTYLN